MLDGVSEIAWDSGGPSGGAAASLGGEGCDRAGAVAATRRAGQDAVHRRPQHPVAVVVDGHGLPPSLLSVGLLFDRSTGRFETVSLLGKMLTLQSGQVTDARSARTWAKRASQAGRGFSPTREFRQRCGWQRPMIGASAARIAQAQSLQGRKSSR